jgi:predicted nicotinamide N-methyase
MKSLIVCNIGAQEVVVTDLGSLVELMDENIKMNGVQANCVSKELFWGADPAPFNPPFDVILLSDVVRACVLIFK